MNTLRIIALVLLTAAWLGGCMFHGFYGADEQFERTVQLSEPAGPGARFAARTSNGFIAVTGTDTQTCDVTATLRTRAETVERAQELAEQTQIRLDRTAEGLTAVIDRPDLNRGESVNVSYDVRLPRQTALDLQSSNGRITLEAIEKAIRVQTSNGKIEITAANGAIEARTSNGGITVRQSDTPSLSLHTSNGSITGEDISGTLNASTSNGSVKIRYAPDADPATDIRITTSNGGIELKVPDNYSARVDAATSNGRIHTNIPITVQGEMGKTIRGTIGSGDAQLTLKTSNSSITIN